MSYFSDLDLVRQEMEKHEPEDISAAMAVRDLMSATLSLSEIASSKSAAPLVRLEANDIELAYTRLGRLLSHLRQDQRHAA